jgi:hypothetical protein
MCLQAILREREVVRQLFVIVFFFLEERKEMLSNETISNIRLHRDTRLEPNAQPFIVPTNGQLHLPITKQQQQQQQRRVAGEHAVSARSSKSTVDAKTRAVSDSCMAAAIGDLQWLKQSIRDGPIGSGEATTIEQTYGKDVCWKNISSIICFFFRLIGSCSYSSRSITWSS